jgi:hypothetical protein
VAFEIAPYAADRQKEWDEVVDASCNGTFLHRRNFMEYHAERFTDASLIVRDDTGKAVAVFPANRSGSGIVSHAGLTYGGLLYSQRLRQAACLEVLEAVLAHYRELAATDLVYKPVPGVFRRTAGEEDLYAVSRCGGRLVRRDVSTVVDLQSEYRFTKGRTWAANKGRKAGIQLARREDPAQFHQLLTEALLRHGASAVHSVEELRLLMARFPEEIALFEARKEDQLLAGAVVFDTGATVHTQYLASSAQGREQGALDFLIAELIRTTYRERHYFSFGISTEQGGMVLNEGLVAQKEGFGGHSRCHDWYQVDLSSGNP